jgi:class 3 adenylate cyclase
LALVDLHTPGTPRRRLTSVLALDICAYSALSERNEDLAITVVHRVTNLLEDVAAKGNGRIFHKAGDGFLAEFSSASACLNGALDILARIQDDAILQTNKIEVRIGLHVGDVADQEDGDLLGHGVNIAARLQAEAEPSGILASANLMNLVSDSFTGQKRRRGPLSLKNISEPVEAYDIAVKTGPILRLAKRTWRPIRRNMVPAGLAILVLTGVFLAPTLTGSNAAAIEARVDTIMSKQFGNEAASTIESAYVRSVLKRLGESDIPSFQASFNMIEAGNIAAAIERMETRLADLSPANPDYNATLHLIGALAYQHEPSKAVAAYETLLTVDPDDVTAQVYRGRALATLGAVRASNAQLLTALDHPALAPEERLRLRLNVAFNQTVLGQSAVGVDMLRALETDVKANGSPSIIAAYQTELGIALERIDRLDEAEGALIMAVDLTTKHGFDHNLERAYNVLGFVAEKRAALSDKHRADYLASAETFYTRQFETSQRIDKKRGMAAALYYRGDIQRRLFKYDAAEATLLRGFKLSREENLRTYEMLARLGLAELALDQADMAKACTQYAQASIIATEREGRIGPRTASRLARFDCAS